ncbi:TetR/AcrR family transcriptional regulator [Mycobacterium sp. OTB74]|uniref:TetR/AcrR family transcriptional regulator n=1 Tax=Mycobacterium sp. OTB74 TaxID=1853452 RepID=UPI002475E0CF|nr:TetR/AcrR family transcriptional regulator [Mycobacterium sp. OTB74]
MEHLSPPEREYVPLPRGYHNLSREEVVASQRGRLLIAAAEIAAEKGYLDTTVGDILTRAKVSRLTFYEQFANKETCIIAAYEMVAAEVASRVQEALATDYDLVDRADHAIRAYLEALAEKPVLARFFLVEATSAGARLRQRRLATQQSVANLIAAQFGASTDGQRTACEALVGAVVALVSARMMTDGPEAVLALHQPILKLATAIWKAFPQL